MPYVLMGSIALSGGFLLTSVKECVQIIVSKLPVRPHSGWTHRASSHNPDCTASFPAPTQPPTVRLQLQLRAVCSSDNRLAFTSGARNITMGVVKLKKRWLQA